LRSLTRVAAILKNVEIRNKPRVLIYDIETAPIIAYVWKLWDNDVALNQIQSDWHLLSWAAKWLDDPAKKIIYKDQRNKKNIQDDKSLLKGIWKLLDKADIVITQNGKKFDQKKLNARFLINGFKPPSSYKHIDTLQIAKKHFGFTSNKLEYMTKKLCTKYKKLAEHKRFPGFLLWSECLRGNLAAWTEMEKYNKYDVLSLEELYRKLVPWDGGIDFNLYADNPIALCNCGSDRIIKNGYSFTNTGKWIRYRCRDCGSEMRAKDNLFSKEKRKSLRVKI